MIEQDMRGDNWGWLLAGDPHGKTLIVRKRATLSHSSRKCMVQIDEAGCGKPDACMIHGPAFWQSVDIEDAPELIGATMALLGYRE